MTSSPCTFARPDLFGATGDSPAETIYVIDADEAVRHSLSLLLKANGLLTEAYARPEDFLRELDSSVVGCLIADPGASPSEGFPLLAQMKARAIRLPVIVTTGSGSLPWAVAAMRGGASDLIEKPFESDALLRSVFRALDAQRAEHSRRSACAEASWRFERLTARERQVLELVTAGAGNKTIARQLGISSRTVETYRASAMAKLDVSRTAELVRLCIDGQFTRRATPSQ